MRAPRKELEEKSVSAVRAEDEALVRVVWPVTPRVPPTVSLPVTADDPVVVLLAMVAEVITALVVVELPTMRSVMFARVAMSDEKNPFVDVALVLDALVAVSVLAVSEIAVVVASVEVPVVVKVLRLVLPPRVVLPETERLVVEALASTV